MHDIIFNRYAQQALAIDPENPRITEESLLEEFTHAKQNEATATVSLDEVEALLERERRMRPSGAGVSTRVVSTEDSNGLYSDRPLGNSLWRHGSNDL